MKLLSLICHSCGAPLDVPAKAASVECEYCRSKFVIEAGQVALDPSVDLMQGADEEAPAESEEVTRLKKQLAMLDVDWFATKARHTSISADGRFTVPDENVARAAMIAGYVFAILVPLVALATQWLSVLILLPVMIFAIRHFSSSIKSAQAYRASHEKYRGRRIQLMAAIHEAQQSVAQ